MPLGEWSFIHEWILYEYMLDRFGKKELRLKCVVRHGKLLSKEEYIDVINLKNITNTDFPDIEGIELKDKHGKENKGQRVAEVKFLTSKFGYHKGDIQRYEDFINNNGCIIVLSHDEMPRGIKEKMDVYELEQLDFISYIRENLISLLNRQMRKSTYSKTWIFYQGPNFNRGVPDIPPARLSGRWCPTDNLTGFDLSVGDKVIFIKTGGISYQKVHGEWNKGIIHDKWVLNEIYVGKVTMGITSRNHYYDKKNMSYDVMLWYDETPQGKKNPKIRKRKKEERWERVFEFESNIVYNNLNIKFFQMPVELNWFIEICKDVYVHQVSRELTNQQYVSLVEYIGSNRDREMELLENENNKIFMELQILGKELEHTKEINNKLKYENLQLRDMNNLPESGVDIKLNI